MHDADAWLRALPPALARQRDVMTAFLRLARSDARIRLFVVGCSLGRGAADELSDVDAVLGVRADAWRDAIASSRGWVGGVAPLIDVWQALIPGGPPEFRESQHTFALYANGVELDLSLWQLAETHRPRADWVVLYDPDRNVAGELVPRDKSATDVRDWAYRVLTRLSACAKYIERGTLWEALNCLELARADFWRIWDVAEGVPDPQWGLTSAFDDPRRPVPPHFERTIASLDARSLVGATLALLDLFVETWPRAMQRVGEPGATVPALASSVRARLGHIAT